VGSGGREGGWVNPNLPTPPVHTAHIRTPNTQPPARALTLCVGYYTAAVLLQPVSWSICACPPPSGPSSRARPSAPRHSARLRHTLVSGVCHTAYSHATPSARLRHTLGMQRRVPRGGRMPPRRLFFASPPLSCRVYYNDWGDQDHPLPLKCLLSFVPRATHSSYPPIHVRPLP